MTGTINENHPEARDGEVWLTNTPVDDYRDIGYKSKRMGTTAYNRNGGVILHGMIPVFINVDEYTAKLDSLRRNRYINYPLTK